MGNRNLGGDAPGAGRPKRRAAPTKAAETFTLLPPVGLPDRKLAIKLMAAVVLSIWEKHRGRGEPSASIEES